MRNVSKLLAGAAVIAALAPGFTTEAMDMDSAVYMVTFTGRWTAETHPFEYPPAGVLTGPHFSGLIGATHSDGFALYKLGTRPTPGLEKLSEEGKHAPLDAEINAAIAAGKAGALIETGPIRDFSRMQAMTFTIDAAHPLVSAVAMIAPSPDWFAGVEGVRLMEQGKWVDSKTVDLFAYDSGGDDGMTYKAADMDTNPKKPTAPGDARFFRVGGKTPAVATLTFTRQR